MRNIPVRTFNPPRLPIDVYCPKPRKGKSLFFHCWDGLCWRILRPENLLAASALTLLLPLYFNQYYYIFNQYLIELGQARGWSSFAELVQRSVYIFDEFSLIRFSVNYPNWDSNYVNFVDCLLYIDVRYCDLWLRQSEIFNFVFYLNLRRYT